MKKFCTNAIAILLSVIVLCGCGQKVDENVKAVIDQIDAIGEVTLDSDSKIQSAKSAYEALTEDQKAQVTNKDKLDEAATAVFKLGKQNFLAELDNYTYKTVGDLQSGIDKYWDVLSEPEKVDSLVALGRCRIKSAVEKEIKKYLKSPNSFYLYDLELGHTTGSRGVYNTTATVRFGATNSFGAEVTDTVTVFVTFMIGIESGKVAITRLDSASFFQWEMNALYGLMR